MPLATPIPLFGPTAFGFPLASDAPPVGGGTGDYFSSSYFAGAYFTPSYFPGTAVDPATVSDVPTNLSWVVRSFTVEPDPFDARIEAL